MLAAMRRASSRVSKYDIAADDPVHDVVERLLKVSGQWVVCAAVDREPSGECSKSSNVSLGYLHHDDTNSGAVPVAVRI